MEFLWGAATSSHQIEGNNIYNDWWQFEQAGRCENGAKSGRATDHWNRIKEDLKLAADLGFNTYRFSIEWSRLEPKEGQWDQSALDTYVGLVDECEKLGLLPNLTLHHFTSPQWFAEQGGFTREDSPDKFMRYADKVINALGARVPLWCTFNEPMVWASGAYMGAFMPPGVYEPKKLSLACRNLLRSHVRAYDRIHQFSGPRQGPWKDHPVMVGIAHNMIDFGPARKWHPIEIIVSEMFKSFYNRSWLDAITGRKQHFGVIGVVPKAAQVPEALGRMTADYIGINYYTKGRVQWRPKVANPEAAAPVPIGLAFADEGDTVSDLGWAIHPQGFQKMIDLAASYGLPIYITENGIACENDKLRERYIQEHLNVVDQSRKNGIDLRGYYHWSLLDNFEWIKGFGPRFGLYRVNYETMERTPNPSALKMKERIKTPRPS